MARTTLRSGEAEATRRIDYGEEPPYDKLIAEAVGEVVYRLGQYPSKLVLLFDSQPDAMGGALKRKARVRARWGPWD